MTCLGMWLFNGMDLWFVLFVEKQTVLQVYFVTVYMKDPSQASCHSVVKFIVEVQSMAEVP